MSRGRGLLVCILHCFFCKYRQIFFITPQKWHTMYAVLHVAFVFFSHLKKDHRDLPGSAHKNFLDPFICQWLLGAPWWGCTIVLFGRLEMDTWVVSMLSVSQQCFGS